MMKSSRGIDISNNNTNAITQSQGRNNYYPTAKTAIILILACLVALQLIFPLAWHAACTKDDIINSAILMDHHHVARNNAAEAMKGESEKSIEILHSMQESTVEERGDGINKNFEEKWPRTKGKLCPKGLPSHARYGMILFDLARAELGLKKMAKRDTRLARFFTFMPNHATAYITPRKKTNKPSSKNNTQSTNTKRNEQHTTQFESFLHLPIWKCANNNVRHNLNITMPIPQSADVAVNGNGKQIKWESYIGGKQNIPKACVVTVVRDPISHFLSGYSEYETRLTNELGTRLKKEKKHVGNPLNFERFSCGTEGRFEQFVVDFLDGPKKSGFFDYWDNLFHMFSMTGVLSQFYRIHKRKLNGYLPTVKDIEINYPAFLNETCPGILPQSTYEPWDKENRKHHDSEADAHGFRAAANAVWANGGRVSRALCLIHAIDYACYDKIPVEEFCKRIYSSDWFVDAIK